MITFGSGCASLDEPPFRRPSPSLPPFRGAISWHEGPTTTRGIAGCGKILAEGL